MSAVTPICSVCRTSRLDNHAGRITCLSCGATAHEAVVTMSPKPGRPSDFMLTKYINDAREPHSCGMGCLVCAQAERARLAMGDW